MTTDHFIPISQGGNDDEKNLIALCLECNKEKDDLIQPIDKYCKYITKAAKKELEAYVGKYYEDNNFISDKNAFLSDVLHLEIPYALKNSKSNKVFQAKRDIAVTKASLKEMEEIYRFILRYNHVYGLEDKRKTSKEKYFNDIKHAVMSRYMSGIYYICRDQKENLDILFYMSQCAFTDGETGESTLSITGEMYITPDHGIKAIANPMNALPYNLDNVKLKKYFHIADQFRRTFSSQFKGEDLIIALPMKILKRDDLAKAIMNAIGSSYSSQNDPEYLISITAYPTSKTLAKYKKKTFADEQNKDLWRMLQENGDREIHERLSAKMTENNESIGMERIEEKAQNGIKLIGALTRDVCETLSAQKLNVQFRNTKQCIFLCIEYGMLPSLRLSLTDIDYGYSKARVVFSLPDEPRMAFFNEEKNCHYWNLGKGNYKETLESVAQYYETQYGEKRKALGEPGYNRSKHGLKKAGALGYENYTTGCKTGLLSFNGNYESRTHIID